MERTAQLQQRVETILRDTLPEVEVVLAEQISPGMLRVTIDRPGGVDVALCERVTRELSALRETYALEVSSPGIERPLRTARHFAPYTGEKVFVEMVHVVDERRRFKGRLVAAGPESVEVEVDGRRHVLPLNGIRKAHLAPDL